MSAPLDLKTTLNLPRTAFSMKANLPVNEPKMLARWREMDIYGQIRAARRGQRSYLLHDGPPYANGAIHLGTAFNKCLKDFVVKSRTMAGFDAPYVPGWDCHGLPIEIKIDESLGRKKLEMAPAQVRAACRDYAKKFLGLQREQFIRLGVFGQFGEPYSTMSPEYEGAVAATFFTFLESGLIYKGLRPVLWCIFDKTALAEAEVEYTDHTSPSIWVKYRLTSDPAAIDPALKGKKVSTIIWTTTPWTLPASMAVAFHPTSRYLAVPDAKSGEAYIIAGDTLPATTQALAKSESPTQFGQPIGAGFPGSKLEGGIFAHPFLDRKILGVLADYVTLDQGTGAVHTAPSHGADDFYTGARYGLDQTSNVDEAGRLHHGLPEYEGKTVFEANAPIIELLRSRGALLASEKLQHSYPHCWRCHNPVIFRATEQWFVAMDKQFAPAEPAANSSGGESETGTTLRHRAHAAAQGVKWDPSWGEVRISNMIDTRPDWCISRQRVWGVPIAVFYCADKKCGALLESKEANRAVIELFSREGADAWYRREAKEILPASLRCATCGGSEFRKETDILDVWFESGCSHRAVLQGKIADLYLEGSDQYRGWFQSSLMCSVGTRGVAPYKMVATPGWTLDEQGQAMHKSRGNDVDPVDIANRLGGEIVRLWVASVDFREDVRGSEALMQRVAENYRKIRNTFRNMLGNLFDFVPTQHAVAVRDMKPLDQYLMLLTAELAREAAVWYEEFAFHKIYHRVNQFCVVELSAFYFDILKDRLYTFAPNSRGRRSAQTALWRICETLVRLLAPIMSFTGEEVWQYLPGVEQRPGSIHLAHFPNPEEIRALEAENSESLRASWNGLLGVREIVLKALEEARNSKTIGSALEAEVEVTAPPEMYALLRKHEAGRGLHELFIVSGVALKSSGPDNGSAPVRVQVHRAPGKKCERCWTYSIHVGEDKTYPGICERCREALREIAAAVGSN
jgi:isoleucyl-tRNA synthetase